MTWSVSNRGTESPACDRTTAGVEKKSPLRSCPASNRFTSSRRTFPGSSLSENDSDSYTDTQSLQDPKFLARYVLKEAWGALVAVPLHSVASESFTIGANQETLLIA